MFEPLKGFKACFCEPCLVLIIKPCAIDSLLIECKLDRSVEHRGIVKQARETHGAHKALVYRHKMLNLLQKGNLLIILSRPGAIHIIGDSKPINDSFDQYKGLSLIEKYHLSN